MADLGLAPSEVRSMTLGEVYAVMWAKTRDTEAQRKKDSNAELYEQFKAMKQREAENGV